MEERHDPASIARWLSLSVATVKVLAERAGYPPDRDDERLPLSPIEDELHKARLGVVPQNSTAACSQGLGSHLRNS